MSDPTIDTAPVAGASAQAEADSHPWRLLAILVTLMAFASISTDLYLPAMPTMGHALGAGPGPVAWTISAYLVGFSLGQLFWGPIGDRHGRRLPIAIGVTLFVIGSIGCAMAAGIWGVIAWRVVQAVGASACVVLSRAMVRDLYVGPRAAQMMSTLLAVMTIAPILGPFIGAEMLAISGWRAIFWTLAVIGLATLASLLTLPETLPAERRNPAPLSQSLSGYALLLRHGRLRAFAGVSGFYYGAMFAYIAGSPFAYISYHHVPTGLYGVIFGATVLGIMGSNIVNMRVVARLGIDRLLLRATGIAAIAAIAIALYIQAEIGGLWGILLPALVFYGCAGFIVANAMAGALNDFPERAGAASALIGACQFGTGVIATTMVGAFADGTPRAMGWVMAIGAVATWQCARMVAAKPAR